MKNVPISKSTILRIIAKTDLSTTEKVIETLNKLHIQVDEVYLTVRNNKQKLYTLSAFTEKKKENDRNVLKNVNLFATWDKNELIEQINFYTNHVYKIGLEKEFYLSGDLATYIQKLNEKLYNFNGIYVPDKRHVLRSLREFDLKKEDISDEKLEATISYLTKMKPSISSLVKERNKILKLLKDKNKPWKYWSEKDYLGCSQECMNSHYLKRKFYRPSCFKKETIIKICIIESAKKSNNPLYIKTKKNKPHELLEKSYSENDRRLVYPSMLNLCEYPLRTKQAFQNLIDLYKIFMYLKGSRPKTKKRYRTKILIFEREKIDFT